MFNIKLEEKPYKMSFKALPVKIQQLKNRQEEQNVPPTGQLGLINFYENNFEKLRFDHFGFDSTGADTAFQRG